MKRTKVSCKSRKFIADQKDKLKYGVHYWKLKLHEKIDSNLQKVIEWLNLNKIIYEEIMFRILQKGELKQIMETIRWKR